MTKPLALSFPLHGSRLIEASAGTGKTYTISALYLRLILQHGGEVAFNQPLLPPQILVVTFTDAATRELRDRIRARLVQAAAVFRGEQEADDLLAMLKADFEAAQYSECARRLELAAQWMDEAAVSTIHGWCQRMLREHAFDSGSLFIQTLETDHSELLAEVVRDYWRRHCYPLRGKALAWVAQQWKEPSNLGAKLRPLLGQPDEAETVGQDLQQLLESTLAARNEQLAQLRAPWTGWVDELEQLLEKGVADKLVDGRKIQARYYRPWLEKIRAWASADTEGLDLGGGFTRLTPEGLADAWKGEPPAHPALDAMALLPAQLAALPEPAEAALRQAAAWVRKRFDWEKRQRAQMGFDDMLLRLDAALQGENGVRLAELIRTQFPVALIDEFQDTDPLQYRIFDSIYQIQENRSDCGIFMIGDPKQAIYSFRGADIHTYLRARCATEGRHYNLDTNFRSSQAMVEAVNQVFMQAQRRSGRGAFLFGEQLPFFAVGAKGRKEHWQVEGQIQPALTLWHLATDEPMGKVDYLKAQAQACASEITRLLNLGQQGLAGFAEDAALTPLQPSDIAILVRDFSEAQAIRDELAQRGVRSVYLSDKDSVLGTREARDMLLWLRACAEPDQDRPLRAALASATLGLTLSDLDQLNSDERKWEARVLQFRDYRQRWQRQGVLPMLRQLMQDFHLAERLMGRSDGERVLTNLLHLAELLQQAAGELDGEQALIRHLSEWLNAGGAADEQIVRLESDEALVRVVTIHKSKGLEYPLVFLPFICLVRPLDAGKPLLVQEDGRRRVVLSPDQHALERAEHERLAEDVRLLYVALTRSQHACWLGLADIKLGQAKDSRLHLSAIGYLLGGGEPLPASAQLAAWLQALEDPAHTSLQALPEPVEHSFNAGQAHQPELSWPVPARRAREHWWIASYSALRLAEDEETATLRHDDHAPDTASRQIAGDDESITAPAPTGAFGLHGFPRGPQPGTFLHGLLEMAAEMGFDRALAQPEVLREQLARRCQRRGWQGWIEPLQDWLHSLLTQPLGLSRESDASLARLEQYQCEMEFWFQASEVDVQVLDALVQQWELPGLARQALRADRLNGMFKGFMDLVFEHQGRFYVLDYKSNWLGADDAAYTQQTMTEAVASHRYDLQYVLYVLALHRQLRLRLGVEYDYDQHLGGALYWFFRAPGHGLYKVRPARELIEQLDALFARAGEVVV
ncbi:exodeoxyribonuclease V subunit beta [Pseudomonas sp. NCCP-436]|uniref:exodeoxyribonuclease V subunit beta n=1 Tax=Pseudomonas sp. NCCP-436 TaxID=2842481 RepID=UPI001C80A163|nr:exodeoxyribonuclease V subunit beta [Pseudomonas sp. NCCP-436]GIZ13960.1 RecBCD enzyme subunit RecB [Pseudomonas sp. NCCP-436]